jgi:hypothetical protein
MKVMAVRLGLVLGLFVVPTLGLAQGPPAANPQLLAPVAQLEATVESLPSSVEDLQATVAAQAEELAALAESEPMKLSPFLAVTTDELENLPLIRFSGVNLQIVNGEGPIDFMLPEEEPGSYLYPTSNGTGNLVIGYNEPAEAINMGPTDRTGSHNLVVGPLHSYAAYGGLVAGFNNKAMAPYSSVCGGWENEALNYLGSVSGGHFGRATGLASSVSGGDSNQASGDYSSVNGGDVNNAAGLAATVGGGHGVTAAADRSWAAGGYTWPE